MRSRVIALSQFGFYFICFFQRAQYRCLSDFVCFYFRLSKYLGCFDGRIYSYILTLFCRNALKQDLQSRCVYLNSLNLHAARFSVLLVLVCSSWHLRADRARCLRLSSRYQSTQRIDSSFSVLSCLKILKPIITRCLSHFMQKSVAFIFSFKILYLKWLYAQSYFMATFFTARLLLSFNFRRRYRTRLSSKFCNFYS